MVCNSVSRTHTFMGSAFFNLRPLASETSRHSLLLLFFLRRVVLFLVGGSGISLKI